MSQFVISGNDLGYFKGILSSALSGEYGEVNSVTVNVENQKLTFAVNGLESSPIGRMTGLGENPSPATDLTENTNGDDKVSKRDLATRVERLERFVADVQATGLLPSGVRLR